MKKSRQNYDFDDFEIDDFNYDDPFQDPADQGKDRNPVIDVAKGAFTGFKETMTDKAFHVNVMRKALPEGYGAAYDVASDITDKGIGLYNQVTTDLRPAIYDLKRIGRRAKGLVDGILPDTFSEKLDEMLKEEPEQNAELSKEEIRNQSINSELAQVFQAQAEEKREDKVEDMMLRVVDSKRHDTMRDLTVGIRDELTRQTAYQDTIDAQWKRKVLELKYRHFFVAKDHYELYKLNQEEMLGHFRAISRNTGLPEAVKVRDSELAMQLTKQRLIGKAQDKFAPLARDFLNAFTDNIGKRVKEKVEEFKDAVATASFAGDMLEGMDLEELGISKAQIGGQMAGETATRKFGEWIGKTFLKDMFAKDDRVAGIGNKLLYGSENYHNILREYLEDKTFTNPIANFFQESALDALRLRRESRVGYDQISNSTDQAEFDNLTRKSIIEVIPGWLSRIWHSLTGNEQGTITFDHATNGFMTSAELSNRIEKEAVRDTELETLKDINKKLFEEVTDGSVDDIQDKVEEMFLRFARNDRSFNPEKLVNGDYQEVSGLGFEEYDRLADAVSEKLKLNYDGKLANDNIEGTNAMVEANRSLRRLRESMPNAYEVANIYANTANREALRDTDIVVNKDGEDHLNEKYLFDRYREFGKDTQRAIPEVNEGIAGLGGFTPPNRSTFTQPTEQDRVINDSKLIKSSIDELIAYLKERSDEEVGQTEFDYDRITSAMDGMTLRKEANEQIEILTDIRSILEELPQHIHYVMGNPDDGEGLSYSEQFKEFSRGVKAGAKRRYTSAKGFLGRTARGAWDIAKKPFGMAKSMFDTLTKPINTVFDMGKKFVGDTIDRVRGLVNQDLFTKDNPDVPVLTKALLEAGEYRDAVTGKVIKKLSDIKGAVKDSKGDFVITPKMFKEGLFTKDGKKVNFKSLTRDLIDLAKKPLAFLKPQRLFGALDVKDKVSGYLNRLPDVYYKDEKYPRLTAREIREGAYHNEKGQTVKTLKDLNSAIYKDKRIVIREDELEGLVDVDRKPLRTFGSKLWSKTKSVIGGTWGAVKALSKKGFNLLKGGADKAADMASGALGWLGDKLPSLSGGISIGGGSYQKRIYSLLLRYFKFRGLEIPDEEIKDATSGPGIFKSVRASFDNLREKFKGVDKEELKGKFEQFKKDAKDKGETLKSKAQERAEKLKEKYRETEDKRSELKDRFNKTKDSFGQKMSGYLDTLFEKFKKFREREEDEKDRERPSFIDKLKNTRQRMQDRAGSYVNIFKEREERRQKERESKKDTFKKQDKKSGGFLSSVLSLLGGATGWLGKIFTGITGLGSLLTGALSALGGGTLLDKFLDFTGFGGDKDGKNKPKGPKNKSWTRRLIKGAWDLGKGALGWGLRAAPVAIPAIASGLGTVASAGSAIIGTTAAVATSAVTLTVGAGALALYGTYKWLSEDMDLLTRLRMAQYGIRELEYDDCVIVGKFEKLLQPFVTVDGERAKLQGKIPFDQVPELFGFELTDKRNVQAWNHWYSNRFLPVFLRNQFMLKHFGKTNDLEKVDSAIPDKEKWNFAQATMLKQSPSPYDVGTSPFGDPDIKMDYGLQKIHNVLHQIKRKYVEGKSGTGKLENLSSVRRRANNLGRKEEEQPKEVKRGYMPSLTNQYSVGAAAAIGKDESAVDYVSAMQDSSKPKEDAPVVKSNSPVTRAKEDQPKESSNVSYINQRRGGTTKAANDHLIQQQINDIVELDTNRLYRPKQLTPRELGKMIASVAELAQVPVKPILELANAASGFNVKKRIGARRGLFLMDASTFRLTMDRVGPRYNIQRGDPNDPLHQTIAAVEFFKIADVKMTRALGRVPTLEERLAALLYGVDEILKLIGSPEDVDLKTIVQGKTLADVDRLKSVETKTEFFADLTKRLDQVTERTTQVTMPKTPRSYVKEKVDFDIHGERTTNNPADSRPAEQSNEIKQMERNAVRRRNQEVQRSEQYRQAQTTAQSSQTNSELQSMNRQLKESHAVYEAQLASLAKIEKILAAQTEISLARPTAEVKEPEKPKATNNVADRTDAPSKPFDSPKINTARYGS